MEKHLEKFCKQNPIFEFECEGCNTINQIPMKDFLKKKYSYEMTCKNCGKTTHIDTRSFHQKLEPLKLFQF